MMPQYSDSPKKFSRQNVVLLAILITSLILLILWLDKLYAYKEIITHNNRENAALAQKLNTFSTPIIEAIDEYQKDHGEYPKDLQILIPDYLSRDLGAVIGDRLTYIPEPYNGVPFYFGFSGNYWGLAFMHGWGVIYCPLSICEIQDMPNDGVHRKGENWIFIHSSAL